MMAAAGVLTGLAKLKRQDSTRSQQRPVSGLGNVAAEAPRKRKWRTDVVVVRGHLRLYSASGFFLLLGLVILIIGIGMATLGYWPHSGRKPLAKTARGEDVSMTTEEDLEGEKLTVTEGILGNVNSSQEMQDMLVKQTGGALSRFLEKHLHSERMKMLGPFTMGIGIFIFICANAILHENRDRETKIIHMRDMYSTVIDIHRLRQREHKQLLHTSTYAKDGYAADNLGPVQSPSHTLLGFSSWAGGSITGSTEEEEVLLAEEDLQRRKESVQLDCSFTGLLAPLYKDRPSFSHSDCAPHQRSVDWDWEKGGHHARFIVSSSISAFTLPVIKLNNCVIDEPEMEAITEEEQGPRRDNRSQPLSSMECLAVPVAMVAKAITPPGLHRSNSASASNSHASSLSSSSLPVPSSTSGCWLSPGTARSDFGSNSSLHMLSSHSKSLDLEHRPSMLTVHTEQRKHPSWPRLDRSNSNCSNSGLRGCSRGYMRLEDREEQTTDLLDVSLSARRDYSKREKLLMISRSHNNLSFEHDEFNSDTLKRESSETRF